MTPAGAISSRKGLTCGLAVGALAGSCGLSSLGFAGPAADGSTAALRGYAELQGQPSGQPSGAAASAGGARAGAAAAVASTAAVALALSRRQRQDPRRGRGVVQLRAKPDEAVDGLMGDLKEVMLNKVAAEASLNDDLTREITELSSQITALRESYSQVCDELEVAETKVQAEVAEATADVRVEKDVAVAKAEAAEAVVGAAVQRVEKAEGDIARDGTTRPIIRGEIQALTKKIVDIGQEKEALATMIATLADEVVATTATLDISEADKAVLDAQLGSVKAQISEFTKAFKDSEITNSKMLECRIIIQGEIRKLTDKVVTGSGEKADLEGAKAATEEEQARLEANIASLINFKASLEDQLDGAKTEVADLEKAVKDVESGKATILQQRKLVQGEVKRLGDQFVSTTAEKLELGEKKVEMEDTVAELTTKETMLSNQLSASRKKASELSKVDMETKKEKDQLMGQFKVIQGEVRKLTDKVVSSRGENEGLENKISSMNTMMMQLEATVQSAEDEKSKFEDQVEKASTEKARLLGNIKKLMGDADQIADQRKMIGKEVMRLTGVLVDVNTTVEQYDAALQQLTEETNSLLNQVQTLQMSKADLLSRVTMFRTESDKLVKTVIMMNEKNQELTECAILTETETAQLETDLKSATSKQKELQLKLDTRVGRLKAEQEAATLKAKEAADAHRKQELEEMGFKDGVAPANLEQVMKEKIANAKWVNNKLQSELEQTQEKLDAMAQRV